MKRRSLSKHEALMWSIGLPGFGQLLNGNVIKGIVFIALEVIINVQSNFNLAIMHSFNGDIKSAIDVTQYQWLMFYPCIYMFAMWDAYQSAEGVITPFSYLPFVFGAFLVTVGLMYSRKIMIMGTLIGPVFLPMLFLIPGLCIGFILKRILILKH